MCDFCREKSRYIFPFDPLGELNVCETCEGLYNKSAREIAFKVKNNIYVNMVKFLTEHCFHVDPIIKEWVDKYFK